MPVVLERLHHLLVIEPWPQVVPPQADAAQYDGTALRIAQLGALYLQLAPLLDGVLSLQGLKRKET